MDLMNAHDLSNLTAATNRASALDTETLTRIETSLVESIERHLLAAA